jgi:hypothetical protein
LTSAVPGQTRADLERAHGAVLAADTDSTFQAALQRYLALLPKVGDEYVVEGDMLRTAKEVETDFVFARGRAAALKQEFTPELVVTLTANGTRQIWKPDQRTLTYSLDRRSFPSPALADEIVATLRNAANEWELVCPECGIRFVFTDDPAPSHSRVVFIVRHTNAGGKFAASAFFPGYASRRRVLYIEKSFFETTADKTGMLRHEIGHVLGYRHEHIRSVPGCVPEGIFWEPLTPYDPKSVMHYVCGGGGTLRFAITDLDRTGHRGLYAIK